MHYARLSVLIGALAVTVAGCHRDKEHPFSGVGHGDDSGDVTDDTAVQPDDTSEPLDDTGVDGLDEPGDTVTYESDDTTGSIDLVDISGDSNKDQEFLLVLINAGEDPLAYSLRYEQYAGSSGRAPTPGAPSAIPAMTPFRRRLRDAIRAGEVKPVAAAVPPPPLESTDIGHETRNFRVRNSLTDDSTYDNMAATLWALGDSVAIWVDDDQPIDWDYECDGVIDEPARYEAYGFDNCDLQTIADIVDANIIPTVRSYFGEESDLNGDGLISVVITPRLNYMSLGAEDEEDRDTPIGSYADPEVDLNEWDINDNPGSDEQEVIYVFAPDPFGYHNPYAPVTVEEYTSMRLAAQIARAFQRLVNYNQHVIVNEAEESEQTWMVEGLSALAADLTGFGAVYYDSAWDYMDASHLTPLVNTGVEGAISTQEWGAQQLFFRYLVDAYGTDIISSMVQTTAVGADNVASAVGIPFNSLVLQWQIALLTTGVQDAEGDPLVSVEDWPPYADAQTISAPVEDPASGDLYGANGYQQGFNIGGDNLYMEGGTTDTPTEVESKRVKLGHTDHYTMVTGVDFTGYLDGGYTSQVVRLTDVNLDETTLKIAASGSDFYGAVVRWTDPETPDYKVEDIFSASDSNNLELPALPEDGSPIYGVGWISSPAATLLVGTSDAGGGADTGGGTGSEATVYDTDRWLLDLTDRVGTVTVAVQLDRHYEGSDGDVAPYDPWLAVVPASLVPSPTVEGTSRGDCADGGDDFSYPSSLLEYLYYQVYVSSTAWSDTADFDACGVASDTETSCADDWDRDGVLDVDEPQPASFLEQVQVMQCTLAGHGEFVAADTSIIDEDEVDTDEEPTRDRARDLGGQSGDSGEEAFLEIALDGGQKYLIVVGAGTDTGVYELTVQQID